MTMATRSASNESTMGNGVQRREMILINIKLLRDWFNRRHQRVEPGPGNDTNLTRSERATPPGSSHGPLCGEVIFLPCVKLQFCRRNRDSLMPQRR